MSSSLEKVLIQTWYGKSILSYILRPVSWLYCILIFLRRWAYRLYLFKSSRLPVPVIVVGNITVGGTGKTPMVIALAEILKQAGYRPGIISRGYKGKASSWPQQVRADSDPTMVGDEAVLIARRTGCPMAVGPKRVAAAKALLDYHSCDIIISDDGLQHYALRRSVEIAVIDGTRRFGNQLCLPAGPLREPVSRLERVDIKVVSGTATVDEVPMRYEFNNVCSLGDESITKPLAEMGNQQVHAVAGIGNPQRFFNTLRQQGLDIIEHEFSDHHAFRASDLSFGDDAAIIMTEKDAVKCKRYANDKMWYLPLATHLPDNFAERFIAIIESKS